MSLTSQLNTKNSPVNQFFDQAFNFPKRTMGSDIKAWPIIWSPPTNAPTMNLTLTGTSFDYIVREVTWGLDVEKTVARIGATRLFMERGMSLTNWEDLVLAWRHDMDDDTLCRNAVILSWYEQYVRSGYLSDTIRELLAYHELDDIRQCVDTSIVGDLTGLLSGYRNTFRDMWSSHSAALNPTFDNSRLVGGADADWIIGSTLWDMKTTKTPGKNLIKHLKQLIGYVLLDASDHYHLTDIGIYFPRSEKYATWNISALLSIIATQPLAILRSDFENTLLNRRHA